MIKLKDFIEEQIEEEIDTDAVRAYARHSSEYKEIILAIDSYNYIYGTNCSIYDL